MDVMSLLELEASLLEWVRHYCEKGGSLNSSLDLETDLIKTGVLDSVAFIELIDFVGSRTGTSILDDPALEQLTSIATICGHVHNLTSTTVAKEVRHSSVIESYSDHAAQYDSLRNLNSCWGQATAQALTTINPRPSDELVVEVGCGTGISLRQVMAKSFPGMRFIGIDPADNMLARASENLKSFANVTLKIGSFEELPIDSDSVDYLFSMFAFHWTTDLDRSVSELARVLKSNGTMDLVFTGRHTGREFVKETTPIFRKYMGVAELLKSTGARQYLTKEEAEQLFRREFASARLTVEESYQTYYDDLEGHWSWWVARASGHFNAIPVEMRERCDEDIRQAIQSLSCDKGIPYTIHMLHVKIRGVPGW
jgi:ubiquinone/menaquinone biosynthesis C-methylase UbiE/acyl carrier protein